MDGIHRQEHLHVVMMMAPSPLQEGALQVLETCRESLASLRVVDNLLTLRRTLVQQEADVILTGLMGRQDRLRDFFLFYSHYLRFNTRTTWLLYGDPLTPLLTTWSALGPGEGPLCLPCDLHPNNLRYLFQERQTLGHRMFMANDLSRLFSPNTVLSWPELQVLSHFVCNSLAQLTTPTGGFTVKTVSAHKRSAMRKLGVRCDQALHALLQNTVGHPPRAQKQLPTRSTYATHIH